MSKAERLLDSDEVLSSIRRLVANKPNASPDETAPSTATAPSNTGEKSDFVDKINASIAEITKNNLQENTDTQNAVINAASKQENVQSNDETGELKVSVTVEKKGLQYDTPTKTAPLILSADMAAPPHDDSAAASSDIQDTAKAEEKVENISDEPERITNEIEEPSSKIHVEEVDAKELSNAQFVDEEALRGIVNEMVRLELQGDLGDRITRNVRKLVRREIHHALASKDVI